MNIYREREKERDIDIYIYIRLVVSSCFIKLSPEHCVHSRMPAAIGLLGDRHP